MELNLWAFFDRVKGVLLTIKVMNLHEASLTQSNSSTFISKVMGLFGLALFVTGLGVYMGITYWASYFYANPATLYVLLGAELLLVFTSTWWARKEPLNYALFSIFTFLSGLTLVPILLSFAAEFQGYDIIYSALFSSTATFLGAGLYGYTTQRSLASFSGFLMMALIGLIIVSIGGIFFPWGNTTEMIVSGFGVLVFAGYAAMDFNRLKAYPEDHYIHAAMALYLDFFNLFVYILRLIAALSRD